MNRAEAVVYLMEACADQETIRRWPRSSTGPEMDVAVLRCHDALNALGVSDDEMIPIVEDHLVRL